MGMDATVTIWVGVRDNDCCLSDIEHDRLDRIYCGEEEIGVGLVVFGHDWDYGTVPFNVSAVSESIEIATNRLKTIFKELDINPNIGVWCQTDFG